MKKRVRTGFIIWAFVLIIIEFIIGLFVHDKFIRPYVGDIIIVVVLYVIVRAVFPLQKVWISLVVTLFSALYEFTQLIPLVDALGIHNRFLRALFGTTFSPEDILCYLVGGLFCVGVDLYLRKNRKKEFIDEENME